jgi:hypothetical protein
VSASANWMCKVCGHRVDGLNIKELLAIDDQHDCKAADLIRRAASVVRSIEHPLDAVLEPVAVWLEAMAHQAEAMTDNTDFGITDEPGSVRSALAVANAMPVEEDWS